VKIARYETSGSVRVGLVEDDAVRPLPAGTDVLDLLADPAAGEPEEGSVPLSEIRLLPPLDPPSIRDFSDFEAHVEGMAMYGPRMRPFPPTGTSGRGSTSRIRTR
jgi:hypothetical protein